MTCLLNPRLILPAFALLWISVGTSCSTTDYYFPPAVGGGYYVSQVKKAGWSAWNFGKRVPKMVNRVVRRDESFWDGDHIHGSPRIVINLGEQRVYYYKGGQLAGMSPISSGREGNGTTPGRFRISEKDIDHKSSWYGDYVDEYGDPVMREIDVRKDRCPPGCRFDGANMRYFMRVNGPIGMHEGYLPGYPASHGCIRLPSHMAEAFYHATPVGTPVEVVR